MRTYTVALPEALIPHLLRELRTPDSDGGAVENVVFGLASAYAHSERTTLRVEGLETFRPTDYAIREAYSVQLTPEALARVVGIATRRRSVVIKFHRHLVYGDKSLAFFSTTDDAADRQLAELFGCDQFASVLLADEPDGGYTFLARVVDAKGELTAGAVVEQRLPLRVHGTGTRAASESPRFARARLEFGAGIVNTLSELRVGVIGCGGLGWRCASTLADSGVGSLLLCDRDRVEERNVLRLEGATDQDIGAEKVLALAGYLSRRHRDLAVSTTNKDVVDTLDREGVERDDLIQALCACDVLLLVTDNHPSRFSVQIVAEQIGVPYVHCGMHAITAQDMYCRLSVHVPPVTPCAVCAKNIDRAEGSRRGHGYIEGVELPNVAAWNAIAAGYVANAVRMLAVPLLGERLREIHSWEIGLSRPSVRTVAVAQDPACPVCGR